MGNLILALLRGVRRGRCCACVGRDGWRHLDATADYEHTQELDVTTRTEALRYWGAVSA